MADDSNEPIPVTIKSDKYQITYIADRDEFRFEFSEPLRLGNVLIERYVLTLEADIVRQMAEVLPPRDPEIVH